MKHPRRALALLTAAALTLTGCSSLLEQEYTYITPHNAATTAEGDPSVLRADSYQELVNALIYFISTGTEKGTVRLYMDGEDLDASLDAACLEVSKEDPLGAYAVEYITFSLSSVVTYSEATVNITYRRTKEQVSSIVQATGITAIRSELAEAMSAFQPECVLRISYFNEDEAFRTWPARPTITPPLPPWVCRSFRCSSTPKAVSSGLWKFCSPIPTSSPRWSGIRPPSPAGWSPCPPPLAIPPATGALSRPPGPLPPLEATTRKAAPPCAR